MTLVPFVERIQIHEKESPRRVGERRFGLQRDRRVERFADSPFAGPRREDQVLRTRPVERRRVGLESRRPVAGLRHGPAIDDAVESGVHVERKHEIVCRARLGVRAPGVGPHVVVVYGDAVEAARARPFGVERIGEQRDAVELRSKRRAYTVRLFAPHRVRRVVGGVGHAATAVGRGRRKDRPERFEDGTGGPVRVLQQEECVPASAVAVSSDQIFDIVRVREAAVIAIRLEMKRHTDVVGSHHVHERGDHSIGVAVAAPPAHVDRAGAGVFDPASVLFHHGRGP